MNKAPTKLTTDNATIASIHYHQSQDWASWIGSLVDENCEIDRVFSDLLLWQICNSTDKSIKSFKKKAQYYKDAYEQTFVNERQAPDGTEISTHYLIVKDGQLAGMGAHSYRKGSATSGSEEAAKYKKA